MKSIVNLKSPKLLRTELCLICQDSRKDENLIKQPSLPILQRILEQLQSQLSAGTLSGTLNEYSYHTSCQKKLNLKVSYKKNKGGIEEVANLSPLKSPKTRSSVPVIQKQICQEDNGKELTVVINNS